MHSSAMNISFSLPEKYSSLSFVKYNVKYNILINGKNDEFFYHLKALFTQIFTLLFCFSLCVLSQCRDRGGSVLAKASFFHIMIEKEKAYDR